MQCRRPETGRARVRSSRFLRPRPLRSLERHHWQGDFSPHAWKTWSADEQKRLTSEAAVRIERNPR
jgi:hypothetical protein